MPKRITRRQRWMLRMREKSNPPEVRMLHRALYNPFFMRAFRTLSRCQKQPDFTEWCEDAEQNLDRATIND